MLAFGVPENFDTTGNYIDSKLANWAMMVNPNSTFTTDASQAINQALASQTQTDSTGQLGAQAFDPSPAAIPEPTTVAMWGLAAIVLVVSRRRSWRTETKAAESRLVLNADSPTCKPPPESHKARHNARPFRPAPRVSPPRQPASRQAPRSDPAITDSTEPM